MEDVNIEENSEGNNVVLERFGGGPSHVVLSSFATNTVRTRGNSRSARGSSPSISRQQKLTGQSSHHNKSSKRIPPWLWIIIARALGIQLHSGEKPVLSSILHILTFGSAICKLQIN